MSRNTAWNIGPRLAAACLLACLALPAGAGPAGVPLPFTAERVGQGALKFLGIRVYDATLWAPDGRWRRDAPYALELTYARKLDGATLTSSTVKELRRQGPLPGERLKAWEQALQAVFPDVQPGDRLAAVRIPGEGVVFHAGTRVLGRIDDEAFAESFFAIWLGPATRSPELRQRLLGG